MRQALIQATFTPLTDCTGRCSSAACTEPTNVEFTVACWEASEHGPLESDVFHACRNHVEALVSTMAIILVEHLHGVADEYFGRGGEANAAD